MTNFVHYPIRSGVDSFAIYKEEVTYGVNPGSWDTNAKHFGIVKSISPSISRNLQKIRGFTGALPANNETPTSRDAIKILPGELDVGFSVEFEPQDFSFLKLFFGTVSTVGSTHNYPQATAASDADKKKYLKIPSISIATRYDFGGSGDSADMAWVFLGLMNDTLNIKAALGNPVSCSMNFAGADIAEEPTVTNIPYTALSSDDVYNFTDVEVVSYGGASIGYIFDGFEFDGTNGAQILKSLGNYKGVHGRVGERNVNCKFDLTFEGKKFFTDVVGGATLSSPILISEVTLRLKKTDTKNLTIHLKNLKLGSLDPSKSYGEIMKGNITLEAEVAWAVEDADLSAAPTSVTVTNVIENATPTIINVGFNTPVTSLNKNHFTVTKDGAAYINFAVTEVDTENYILTLDDAATSGEVYTVIIGKEGFTFSPTTVTNNVA